MSRFDRFADWLAGIWASGAWFSICALFVAGWLVSGLYFGAGNETWHLWLNSPTTALTFLGVYALHNTQHRFEKAQNERWEALLEHLGIQDPVDDEGQKESTDATGT